MLGELLDNKHIATKQSMNLHLVEIEITHGNLIEEATTSYEPTQLQTSKLWIANSQGPLNLTLFDLTLNVKC